MQTFTMVEIINVLSGRACSEPDGSTIDLNGFIALLSRFGGSWSSPEIAVANIKACLSAEIQDAVSRISGKKDITVIRDLLIAMHGNSIQLPITARPGGAAFV